jgi:hypothetical protein
MVYDSAAFVGIQYTYAYSFLQRLFYFGKKVPNEIVIKIVYQNWKHL